ncbi:MAG: hypothetical protein HGN29_01845 [Asgard group archaeon]|nr:hypothetical protein [Asgard group archaeon]
MKVTYDRYPELEQFLKAFTELVATSLATRSVILFGGLTLDDFSKRYSVIDVVVILEKGLWQNDYDVLDDILSRLDKLNKEFAEIFTVYFIPFTMLENPRIIYNDLEGMVAHHLNQEIINQYPLTLIDDYMILNKGEVLYGENLIKLFPIPPLDCFWIKFIEDLTEMEKLCKEYPFQPSKSPDYNHAANWILHFPRLLFSLKNNDTTGKLKAAYWFSNEYYGVLGDFVVEVASCRQKNISLISVIEVVENSRKLFLFTLEKAFETKGKKLPNLWNLVKITDDHADFSRVFMELRNFI